MLINQEEEKQLQKIRDTDYQTIVSGKDNGVPFLTYVFKLHYKLFGETCSNCPNKLPGYIQKLKSFNTKNQMETKTKSNYVLNGTCTIPVPGTSKAYSNANLTDEIALELLAKNPNRKSLFSKLPKNVDALIEAHNSGNGKTATPLADNLVKIGDTVITIEQATSLLEKVGVETKATSVKGIKTAIAKLDADKLIEFETLLIEVKDETVVNEELENAE
jgi:hypothetical protein